MSELNICRICLRTEAKGYKFIRYQLKYFYEEVTAAKVSDNDELPQWFCYECAAMLHKFHKFKEKCYMGQKFLKEILWKGPITYEAIYKLPQASKLQSTLKIITKTDKVKLFKVFEHIVNNKSENTVQTIEMYSNKNHMTNNLVNNSNQFNNNTGNIIFNLDTNQTESTKDINNLEVANVNNIDDFKTEDILKLDAESYLDTDNVNNLNNINKLKTENVMHLYAENELDTKIINYFNNKINDSKINNTISLDAENENTDTYNVNNLVKKNINNVDTDSITNLKTENIMILDAKNDINPDNANNLDTNKTNHSNTDNIDVLEKENNLNLDTENYLDTNNANNLDTNKLEAEILITLKSNEEHFDASTFNSNAQANFCNDISSDPVSPISILVQKDKVVNLKSENINTTKSKNIEISLSSNKLSRYLNEENWKRVILTEEEAVKEFRRKADDPKYLDATFKCTDCFKGFSKKDMLNRHILSRHSELGGVECRYCRMRFKWKCQLRKHIMQHYTKYVCLRCSFVFHSDASALLHEEYHSGTTKKCEYCNEEFRHLTTYYTHMRTHRSAHVCVRCGASFVSRAGLHQHARIKHPDELFDSLSSESEEDGRESYCTRCDLRFHSPRAHTEHLFHSDMHTEVIKKEDDAQVTRKIMGKKLREKITKELRKRKPDLDTFTPVKNKRRRIKKRKHRKPSSCYQCGMEFATQAACMKHHLAAHPRTSFHSPHDRHICELCGASLAPGSVAMHQNMHSRETVHTCDTCGRQFHSAVGLKRHLVTHTGEKPFACSLCEKRFTQSNSMKLHYKTFHLKQPYPKRIRKKKKDQPNQSTEQDDTYEESDSVPEAAAPEVPEIPAPLEVPAVLQVVGENGASLQEENMHYLTLS